MSEQYRKFKEVRSILEDIGYKDDEISENYRTIFQKLGPNPFTFQQVMVEYLSEFNVKSLDFIDQKHWSKGIRVQRLDNELIVTDVFEDTRFVVGDRIVALSGDSIKDLGERYRKLLFYETNERQDWNPILKKQHAAKVLRGTVVEEVYDFELKSFIDELKLEVYDHEDFKEIIVHDMRELYHYIKQEQYHLSNNLLLDFRTAFGILNEDEVDFLAHTLNNLSHSIIILVGAFTKGSAERVAGKLQPLTLGQETFGQAGALEVKMMDEQMLIYSRSEDRTVLPQHVIELKLESMHDETREKGIEVLTS